MVLMQCRWNVVGGSYFRTANTTPEVRRCFALSYAGTACGLAPSSQTREIFDLLVVAVLNGCAAVHGAAPAKRGHDLEGAVALRWLVFGAFAGLREKNRSSSTLLSMMGLCRWWNSGCHCVGRDVAFAGGMAVNGLRNVVGHAPGLNRKLRRYLLMPWWWMLLTRAM